MNHKKELDLVKMAEKDQVDVMANQLVNPSGCAGRTWPAQFSAFDVVSAVPKLEIIVIDQE